MRICDNCGKDVPEGKSFCGKCGSRLPPSDAEPQSPAGGSAHPSVAPGEAELTIVGDFGGMDVYDPKRDKWDGKTVTGLGFTSESVAEAEQFAEEKKKQERIKKPASAQMPGSSKSAPAAAAASADQPEVDEELIQDLLAEEEKKARRKKRIEFLKSPVIWLTAGALLLAPALLYPWFNFYEGKPLTAFSLPVLFLFFDRVDLLPQVTVGLTLSAIFILNLFLAVFPKRIATFMQLFSIVLILLTFGSVLLALRHWNAMNGYGPLYEQYLQNRIVRLPSDPAPALMVFGKPPVAAQVGAPAQAAPVGGKLISRQAIPGRPTAGRFSRTPVPGTVYAGKLAVGAAAAENAAPAKSVPAGNLEKAWYAFFIRVLGIGVVFPLLSALAVLWVCTRSAGDLKHIEFQIPVTVAAIMLIVGCIAIVLFLFARITPMRWYYTQSELLVLMGKTDAAQRKLEWCAKMPAPDFLCREALGRVYWSERRVNDARSLFLSVENEKPDFPDAHRDLGDLYFNEKQYWRASVEYRRYLKLRPGDLSVKDKLSCSLVAIANKYYGYGKFGSAARLYAEAFDLVDRNKTDTVLQFNAGDAYYQIGKLDKATEHFKAAADLQPHDFELQIHVGKVFAEKGDFKTAILYYEKSIAAKPDNSMSYVYIGDLYRDIWKDAARAKEWYKKAIDANPVSDGAEVARKAMENLRI
jgi:tetratricopeptide (TPR) repeat protein